MSVQSIVLGGEPLPAARSSWLKTCIRAPGYPAIPDDALVLHNVDHVSDHSRLFTTWIRHPEAQEKRRALIVLHGQGEHSGRYLPLVAEFWNQFTDFILFDHQGHGRSEGQRGHVEKFEDYSIDALEVIRRAHDRIVFSGGESIEWHLLGHSMGGLIALDLCELIKAQDPGRNEDERPIEFQSIVFSAPLLGLKVPVPFLKKALAYSIAGVFGSLSMKTTLNPEALSHDREICRIYTEDKLNHNRVTPRFFIDLLARMERHNHLPVVELPAKALFVVSGRDEIVDSDAARLFAAKVRSPFEVIEFREFFHEPHHEVLRAEYFTVLRNFWS